MKILINGDTENFEEFKTKFGDDFKYTLVHDISSSQSILPKQDFIFDFLIDEQPDNIEFYEHLNGPIIFLNVVKTSLAELFFINGGAIKNIFGFNGLPTFLGRNVLEVSSFANDKESLDRGVERLNTEYSLVEDRVGMVTPRIICMIINEAFYTLQEGTAEKGDIDNAMKLGTNYPHGPFEWSELIGIHHVYETLEALFDDTKDERYKICPLLKKEYLTAFS
ncbi:MAG: 3-hydroxyacyl-CoA dehydrogenase family protein [Bacteroidota bacterium]